MRFLAIPVSFIKFPIQDFLNNVLLAYSQQNLVFPKFSQLSDAADFSSFSLVFHKLTNYV